MKLRANRIGMHGERRSGVVLLAVLVVLVLLSLAAYQYSDLMMAESQASENYHRIARVKAVAESGVHYTAALLSNPTHWEDMLGHNPFDNPEVFSAVPVKGADGLPIGYFTILGPLDPEDGAGGFRHGVSDETGKINLNAMMKRDPSGMELFEMLKKLPDMDEATAAAIVDWVDEDSEPYDGLGSEDYSGQGYRAKNGPLDSLEELLLVAGVTEDLLFGSDRNRNGIEDPGEGDGDFHRGWSAYLTLHSREQTLNSRAEPLLYVNDDTDLEGLYIYMLEMGVNEDLAKFVILYRQNGPASNSGGSQSMGRSIGTLFSFKRSSSRRPEPVEGALADAELDFEKPAKRQLRSLFDLVDAKVSVPNPERGKPATIYSSPLKDESQRAELLAGLFEAVTVFEETDIPARININTAPREVLAALPELTEADVEAIVSLRPDFTSGSFPSASYQTPAWLLNEAGIRVATLRRIEKLITTRSQVFKVQVLGYLEEKRGPAARVEAVIDTNGGRPRIIAWRDLSALGRTVR